jgi:hypothetical protein
MRAIIAQEPARIKPQSGKELSTGQYASELLAANGAFVGMKLPYF